MDTLTTCTSTKNTQSYHSLYLNDRQYLVFLHLDLPQCTHEERQSCLLADSGHPNPCLENNSKLDAWSLSYGQLNQLYFCSTIKFSELLGVKLYVLAVWIWLDLQNVFKSCSSSDKKTPRRIWSFWIICLDRNVPGLHTKICLQPRNAGKCSLYILDVKCFV